VLYHRGIDADGRHLRGRRAASCGCRAFWQREATLPGVSLPSSVVRSTIETAVFRPQSFEALFDRTRAVFRDALGFRRSATRSSTNYAGPVVAAQLAEPQNEETSGLAVSHRTPGLFWTHNDSGGEPVLFALNADGSRRGQIRVEGVTQLRLGGDGLLRARRPGVAARRRHRRQLRAAPAAACSTSSRSPDAAALAPDRELRPARRPIPSTSSTRTAPATPNRSPSTCGNA
jgi:hypothetical protein